MTDSPLFSAVARFLRHLGVERQLSPITLLNYQRQLDALIALADEAGLKSWSQCDAAQVRSFAVRSRLSLIHISEPTRHFKRSRMPSSA